MDKEQPSRSPLIHIVLFILTVWSTVLAGTSWAMRDYTVIENWQYGVLYSVLLLSFLSAHEFGHYYTAMYHKIKTTLPYFIPIPIPGLSLFGTLGAIIRIKQRIEQKSVLFDIAVAGPLAGFVVCIVLIVVGVATLPPIDYLVRIHPEIAVTGLKTGGLTFGDNVIFMATRSIATSMGAFFPPMNEIYHYPFFCAAWFGLFVTSLNLLPIGQLDGGHILYALIGKKQHHVAVVLWYFMLSIGVIGILNVGVQDPLFRDSSNIYALGLVKVISYIHMILPFTQEVSGTWVFWAFLVRVVIGLKHPVIQDEQPLSKGRIALGIVSVLILIASAPINTISFGD